MNLIETVAKQQLIHQKWFHGNNHKKKSISQFMLRRMTDTTFAFVIYY